MSKIKNLGQIFTPENIVNDILDSVGYFGKDILKKHIIDNSCGDGAFLKEIVKRYIKESKKANLTDNEIKIHLEKYIHGIEIEQDAYLSCINNLDEIANKEFPNKVCWDVINEDALKVDKYDNKMDYVVGNPPYVRIHNLKELYNDVKNLNFSKNGMTDLYIVFYEIGFNMLNYSGKLSYITPSSFYTSVAGAELRKYILKNKNLYKIIELGHYQPFNVTTYTTIVCFDKSKNYDKINYCKYSENGEVDFVSEISYNNLIIGDKIYLNKDGNTDLSKILNYTAESKRVVVKNAFATLNDKFFISDKFDFDESVIDVIKASTGKWRRCIFPYDEKGKLVSFESLKSDKLKEYLIKNKELLSERSLDKNSKWYAFGRSQAINDVYKDKIAINTIVKDVNSIKLNFVKSGKGVYSGLYIITEVAFEIIEKLIKSEEFINYISLIGKFKNGGCYTFSSKELENYLNYKLEELYE